MTDTTNGAPPEAEEAPERVVERILATMPARTAQRRVRWTVAELLSIVDLATAATEHTSRDPALVTRLRTIAEKAAALAAARVSPRHDAAASAAHRRVQVAYTVPVEVIVDLDTGLVDRVVVIDEAFELDASEGARAAYDLTPVSATTARHAIAIAELDDTQASAQIGWPRFDYGM